MHAVDPRLLEADRETRDVSSSDDDRVHRDSVAPPWRVSAWGIPEWFVVSQTALPALLFLPGTQLLRLPLRVSAFVIAIGVGVLLRFLRDTPVLPRHPATKWLVGATVFMTLNVVHPTTNSLSGALAQIFVVVCVIAPLLWAPHLVRTPEQLRRLAILLLMCNGVNSIVGVMQVYAPDVWLPAEFSRLVTESRFGLGPVSYIGPDGGRIVRPTGLFDTPGAVAGPGMLAALLGVVFAASPIKILFRLGSAGLALAGITAIYLTQVRISLVMVLAMLVVYFVVLLAQGRRVRATMFGSIFAGILVAGFSLATVLGGASIVERFATLFAQDPISLYYASRGGQITSTFGDLLFEAPLGSGLGRWGMAARYFSDPANLDAPAIWAEIQLNGWMIDGGVVLVASYVLALLSTALYERRVALRSQDDWVRSSGALVLAANLGCAALIFSFTPFVTQVGIQYWFLAGALHGVVLHKGQNRFV